MRSGGAQQFGQRLQPAQSVFFGHGLGCTFAKALFCRRRRRAPGAFEGPATLKPVFDRPHACTARQLGPQERKERKRAGNLSSGPHPLGESHHHRVILYEGATPAHLRTHSAQPTASHGAQPRPGADRRPGAAVHARLGRRRRKDGKGAAGAPPRAAARPRGARRAACGAARPPPRILPSDAAWRRAARSRGATRSSRGAE